MSKFEQLIEYVINDENDKARELFHSIVVEKSRAIYEQMMEDEELDEAKDEEAEDEELDEAKDEEAEDEKLDEAEDEDLDESMDETMGGDQADDLIDDIETEEEGLSMEGEGEEEMDSADDEEAAEDHENRVVNLEDTLDELMAEFESLMGYEGGDDMGSDDMGDDMGGEEEFGDDGMSDEEVADDEFETEGMMENVSLKSAPAPVKSEEGGINKKAVYAANSGQKGMAATPKDLNQGGEAQGRPAPGTKELIGKVQNTPAQSTVKQAPATKPHLAQATGVNIKSPLPRQ